MVLCRRSIDGDCPMSAQTVDFQQVKAAASPDAVARYLNLNLKQHGDTLRGRCPICNSDDQRAFVITVSKRLFHCFKCKPNAGQKAGGDMIALVARVKDLPVRDAAIALAKFLGVEVGRDGQTGSFNSSPQPRAKGIRCRKICGGSGPVARLARTLGNFARDLSRMEGRLLPFRRSSRAACASDRHQRRHRDRLLRARAQR